MEAVEGIYGVRGGRRLIKQSGHYCFKYGIEGFGGVIGFADFALRLIPVSLRVRIGLEVLAEIFNRYSDQFITLGENEDWYFFMMKQCGLCWGRQTEGVACALAEGLLEETLYWITRGRRFAVEEFICLATGQAMCAIQVGKTPLN
ncbi:MAG: hypothetical protein JXA33_04270 [Anaerolineae bacterium]|nr:hypothetical protein [Anaerolineae bacterium]